MGTVNGTVSLFVSRSHIHTSCLDASQVGGIVHSKPWLRPHIIPASFHTSCEFWTKILKAAFPGCVQNVNVIMRLVSLCRSVLPVQPTAVGPAISLELDVDDGEVENYEVKYRLQWSKPFLKLYPLGGGSELKHSCMAGFRSDSQPAILGPLLSVSSSTEHKRTLSFIKLSSKATNCELNLLLHLKAFY